MNYLFIYGLLATYNNVLIKLLKLKQVHFKHHKKYVNVDLL